MDNLRILSIDGGGVRVVIAVHIMARLEQYIGAPLNQAFDMVAGTSAGAVAACCIANGWSARDMDAQWDDFARRTFPRPRTFRDIARRVANIGGVLPKYDGESVNAVLRDLFGDAVMADLIVPHVMTVAFDPTTMSVQVIRSSDPKHRQTKVWEACRASSAGPMYLDAGPNGLLDGGVVGNNPTTLAIIHGIEVARERYATDGNADDHLLVVSVGTGMPLRDRTAPRNIIGHVRRLLDIQLYADTPIWRLLKPKTYWRVQPVIPPYLATTDDARRLPELRLVAESFANNIDPTLRSIADSLA